MDTNYFQGPAAAAALGKAQMDLAVLEKEVEHLADAVADLKASNANMQKQLEEIKALLSEAKGGWRMMMLIGGACMSLGGFFAWALQHITVK